MLVAPVVMAALANAGVSVEEVTPAVLLILFCLRFRFMIIRYFGHNPVIQFQLVVFDFRHVISFHLHMPFFIAFLIVLARLKRLSK